MKNEKATKIIDKALKQGRKTLSEYEAKLILAAYEIPITKEILVKDKEHLEKAVQKIGFPLVMKGCSSEIAHKTEKGLIHVDIRTATEAKKAFREIMAGMEGFEGGVLLQEMIKGRRELVMGLTRDPQFGPCVMFGLGGIFTEILKDISFRRAPLEVRDAQEMMEEIRGHKILDAVRGMEAADKKQLTHMLINLGRIGLDYDSVMEIDLNPVILNGSKPVVVDALIVLK
ncbi:MAG: carboxylate--amine ligase [Deltaproteobacteria bacterium]|nr:carboxylate--amine ligase [Deltaproteobacteria bacterium]